MAVMIWYFIQQYRHSKSNIVSETMKEEMIKKSIRNGLVNISGVLCNEIDVTSLSSSHPVDHRLVGPFRATSPRGRRRAPAHPSAWLLAALRHE